MRWLILRVIHLFGHVAGRGERFCAVCGLRVLSPDGDDWAGRRRL